MAHQVVCRTRVDEPGRTLEFTWSVGSSAFPTYALRDDLVEQFRENTKEARDRLFDLVSLYQLAAADRDLPGAATLLPRTGRIGPQPLQPDLRARGPAQRRDEDGPPLAARGHRDRWRPEPGSR